MTQLYGSVAIGTGAALLAILLLLLRAEFRGRRPVLALTRRWVAASARSSTLVLALLSAIAVYCFAYVPAHVGSGSSSAAPPRVIANAPTARGTASASGESSGDPQALDALRAYADKLDPEKQSTAGTSPAAGSAELPAVDTMIAKLAARLEKEPDDVKGWKMLGWSYLNTGRPGDAATAYETALKLAPDDPEIRKSLDQARLAQIAKGGTSPSDPAASPPAEDVKASGGQSEGEVNSMVRGMVDRLAARLESSPNDEEGWVRLMRSRMTLGEKGAAKAALTKALETFASDAAVKGRLTAAARELGVESD